jgi:hypothetical protein
MKLLAALALSVMALPAAAQTAAPASAAARPDYAESANWLCRPGRKDSCTANQDVTVIDAHGRRSVDKFYPAIDPPIDCFYVYPTVSLDATPNSDLVMGPEEQAVAVTQASRFRGECRVFAPLYRQVTLTALRARMAGQPDLGDRELAYRDVLTAWRHYLAHDNHGRGFVLIGHSQGAALLKRLLAEAIEGRRGADLLVGAYLAGTNVAVPRGKLAGGDLKTPLCNHYEQVGCVMAWTSFRADAPPPPDSPFGRVDRPGMVAACVNPADPRGGKVEADAILGTDGAGPASAPMGPWTKDGKPVKTPFVEAPHLLSIECVEKNGFHYLAVTVHSKPKDIRTDTIVGDVVIGGAVAPKWGLHLIDLAEVMGDLETGIARQGREWLAMQKTTPFTRLPSIPVGL